MIEQGRHLNELIERAALTNREEKRQMIAAASLLLTDTDPVKGNIGVNFVVTISFHFHFLYIISLIERVTEKRIIKASFS